MTSSERRLLLVTSFGHFMSHYNMTVFSCVVLPLSSLLGMTMPQVLGLSFPQYLLFGVMALPWGIAGDRVSGKGLMMIMFLGAGMSGLAAALWIESPTALWLALAGVGLFSAIYHPIGIGLISKGMSRVSVAMGYNAAFGGLGLVVAPLITGIVVWIAGLRAAYVTLGALNLLGLALMAGLSLDESHENSRQDNQENNGLLGAFLILLVAMMLAGVVFSGSTLLLPSYLELKGQGIVSAVSSLWGGAISSNLVANTAASGVYVIGMIGQYVGGHVGERFDRRYSYLVFHSVCIPAAFLMAYTQNFELAGLASCFFFFQLGMQAIENTLVANYTPSRLRHSAYGLKFVLTFGVGALAVKMTQAIEASWGIEACYLALSLVSVLIVTTILVLIAWTNRAYRSHRLAEAQIN